MELIDIDAFLVRTLGFRDYGEYSQFFSHFFLHAFIAFTLISIDWRLGFLSLAFALGKELINDGHWKDLFTSRDGLLDLTSRSLGAFIPYITLIWK